MINSVIESLLGLIGDLLLDWSNAIFGYTTLDLSLLIHAMPALETLSTVMLALGIAVLFVCCATEAVQLISSPLTGQQKRGGLYTFARLFICGILVFAILPVSMAVLDGLNSLYEGIMATTDQAIEATKAYDVATIVSEFDAEDMSEMIAGSMSSSTASILFGLVMVILLFFQFFKLAISMIMRYITFGLGIFVSPMCMAFGASDATSNIPKGWLKTMLAQIVLFFVTAWAVSVMYGSLMVWSYVDEAGNVVAITGTEYFLKCVIIYAFGKVILKMDEFLQRIGFNTMPTSASARGALSGIMALGMMIGKTVSGARGGGRTGSSTVATGNSGASSMTKIDPATGKAGTPDRYGKGVSKDDIRKYEQAAANYNRAVDEAKEKGTAKIDNADVEALFGVDAKSGGKTTLAKDGQGTVDRYGGVKVQTRENTGANTYKDKQSYISPAGNGVFEMNAGGAPDGGGTARDGEVLDRSAEGFTISDPSRYSDMGNGIRMYDAPDVQADTYTPPQTAPAGTAPQQTVGTYTPPQTAGTPQQAAQTVQAGQTVQTVQTAREAQAGTVYTGSTGSYGNYGNPGGSQPSGTRTGSYTRTSPSGSRRTYSRNRKK